MRAPLAFVAGLLATPIVTYVIGFVLCGARDTWDVGQGESFLVFYVSLWTTPFGAIYWCVVAYVLTKHERTLPVRKLLFIAVAVYLLVIGSTLVLFGIKYA